MDVLEILSNEHRLVVNMLQRIDKTDSADAKALMLKQLVQDLSAHEKAEEAAVYPRLRQLIPNLTAVETAIQEQLALRKVLDQAGPNLDVTPLVSQVDQLTKMILGHIMTEEQEIFTLVEQQVDEAILQELGVAYMAAKTHQVETMAKLNVTMMPETSKLADEVQDLKSTVSDLKSMLVTIVGQLDNQPRTPVQFPPVLQRVFERLLACDVEPSIARGLVVYLQKEQPHLETFEELVDALEIPISGLYHVAGPVKVATGEQKVVALVGPTGVGKTTTIAKLAANFALAREVNMALFTIDTYRVAAVEQLKTYGDIIGLPVETILTPQGLKEALKQHGQKDLILIDTAGRSPYNRMHLNELKSFLDFRPQRETHLVLSATTRLADLKQIVRNFTATGVDRLIFTKTDETEVVGGIISIAHETGLPVSYITTGQSVPDDIMVAEQPSLAKMLIQELKG
ncbi:MAG: hemerythrin domain-containing protein [Candidatus Sericytochromatia bacterium]